MQKFNIHTVQENDTLKSIAALYGIDKDALKLFHNNLCSVRDMVLIELTGQKEIFIPRSSAVDQDKKYRWVELTVWYLTLQKYTGNTVPLSLLKTEIISTSSNMKFQYDGSEVKDDNIILK